MPTTKPLRAALCGVAVLLLTACGADGHGYSPDELNEMIADTVRASTRDGADGLGVPDTVFDPVTYMCSPAVDARAADDPWRTEAPRSPAAPDDPVELGVLVPDGTATAALTASVIGPEGEAAATDADAAPGEWTRLDYPDDFDDADASAESGVYTVVWSDAATATPLTCDGFELE